MERPEPVFACNMYAIATDEREAHQKHAERIFSAVQEIRELPTGYALRLPNESEMLYAVAALISNERLCCPFFHFRLDVEPNQGPFWLSLTGAADIKPFLRSLNISLIDQTL